MGTPVDVILESHFKGLLNWSIAKLSEKEYFVQIRGENCYWGTGTGETVETAIKRAYEKAERIKDGRDKTGTY